MENHNGHFALAIPAVLPNGDGSFKPCPEVLTEAEAIQFLRIDKQRSDPKKTLRYYREKKKLKATKIGKNLLYSRKKLDEFIEEMSK